MAEVDESSLVEKLIGRLRERGETLSLAESCTGGLASSLLTSFSGVSDVYIGSVVAYSNQIKTKWLGVPDTLLKTVGAVSSPVAKRMAEGAKESFKTTWALSITGIAGPGGGTPQKPVGTVCFGLVGPGFVRTDQQEFKGDRRQIQMASAEHALRLLLNELDEGAR